ncbi:Interleukin-18 [Camelus dromedarius]|uniref:Interleukin-18 n=1 Tax=Camelus dromedarius TaxID=9838 RepID=A0A5N4C8H8_CAMDR|nr:Interleukin-18 [Camelus dromedarius]
MRKKKKRIGERKRTTILVIIDVLRSNKKSGIKMAVQPIEDNCMSFVEMRFINNTLYFVAENDALKIKSQKASITFSNREFCDLGGSNLVEKWRQRQIAHAHLLIFISDNAPQTLFIINVYRDSLIRGVAVTISVRCRKTYTLSCKDKIVSFKSILKSRCDKIIGIVQAVLSGDQQDYSLK